ncbi:MAG: hypothetical protein IKV97_07065, partial [Clostridia bacterium]|nr:hypothetical protein [Clostridia bacterium]
MIDLHTHALPDIDDGAKNAYESMRMLSDSFSQGIKVCALTPHCMVHGQEDVNVFLRRREDSVIRLANIFGSFSVPKLLLGAEVFLDHDISSYRGIKQLCLENTDYIMVELPTNAKPKWLSDCVYSLGIRGIGVIIAHIDRYPYAPRVIEELCGFDVCYQINSSRFLSFFDR